MNLSALRFGPAWKNGGHAVGVRCSETHLLRGRAGVRRFSASYWWWIPGTWASLRLARHNLGNEADHRPE